MNGSQITTESLSNSYEENIDQLKRYFESHINTMKQAIQNLELQNNVLKQDLYNTQHILHMSNVNVALLCKDKNKSAINTLADVFPVHCIKWLKLDLPKKTLNKNKISIEHVKSLCNSSQWTNLIELTHKHHLGNTLHHIELSLSQIRLDSNSSSINHVFFTDKNEISHLQTPTRHNILAIIESSDYSKHAKKTAQNLLNLILEMTSQTKQRLLLSTSN